MYFCRISVLNLNLQTMELCNIKKRTNLTSNNQTVQQENVVYCLGNLPSSDWYPCFQINFPYSWWHSNIMCVVTRAFTVWSLGE